MDGRVDLLQHLNTERRSWRIQVRLVRTWMQPSYSKSTAPGDCLEMVVVDREGTRIQATVNSYHVSKFQPRLEELGTYFISDFTVLANRQTGFKPSHTKYRIVFLHKTVVAPCDAPLLPPFGLHLTDYTTIAQASNNNEFLIDVAGVIVSMSELHQFHSGDNYYRNINFELDNLQGSRVKCVLWADYADQLVNYVAANKQGPYVVVVQFGKTETKLADSSEDSTQSYVQLSSISTYSIEADFLNDNDFKTLDDLRLYDKPGKCIIYAMIDSFVPRTKWWYNGCPSKKCLKSVSFDGNGWFCKKCSSTWPDPMPMYKLDMKVVDETNLSTFIVFGSESEKIVKMAASTLVERILQREEDPSSIPPELECLVGKSFLFKVQINKDNVEDPEGTKFHVQRICDDDKVTRAFLDKNKVQQCIHSQASEVFPGSPSTTNATNLSYLSSKASATTVGLSDSIEDVTPIKDCTVNSSKPKHDVSHSVTKASKRIKQEK